MNADGQIQLGAAHQHPLQLHPLQQQQPQFQPPVPPQQPQQHVPPAPGAFGLPAPPAATSVGGPYRQYYNSAANDPFLGLYTAAYSEFATPLAGPVLNTPAELATKVYQAGEQGYAMVFVLLAHSSTAAAQDIGQVHAYHRVTKFSPRIGMLATPWDDIAFAFSGDMQHGQAPTSVVWQNTYFHMINTTHVPTVEQLDQLLATHPDEQAFGPFANGDAGTELIRTRQSMYLPTKYVPMLLDAGLSPRDAWLRLRTTIETNGEQQACGPLINWLRVALTRSAALLPSRLVTEYPAAPPTAFPVDMSSFINYRWSFVDRDLPNLRTGPVALGAQQIASGLGALVTKQRQNRQADEQRRSQKANKTPSSYFGRWCQATNETQLPEVCRRLANAPKANHRRVIQNCANETAEVLSFRHRNMQITKTVSTKIVELDWVSYNMEDLSAGIHPFTVGYVSPDDAEKQRQQNIQNDMLSEGTAAPTLADTRSLLTTEAHLLLTTLQARITMQRYYVLIYTLLGANHPKSIDLKSFYDDFIAREPELESLQSCSPQNYYIIPALLICWVQLEESYWFRRQAESTQPIQVYQLSAVFDDISRGKDWEPLFPSRYVQQPTVAPSGHSVITDTSSSTMSALTNNTGSTPPATAPSTGSTSTSGSAAQPPDQAIVTISTYNENFSSFKALNLRSQDVCSRAARPPPCGSNGRIPMCLSYHIKGMCNTRCGSSSDHVPHTPAQDQALLAWCTECYLPAGPASK